MENLKRYLYGAYAAVVAILAAAVYYLLSRVDALKSKNAKLEGEKDLREKLVEVDKQREIANEAEGEYTTTRDEFLKPDSNSD